MSEKDEKATPPVIPTAPSPPVIPPPLGSTVPSPPTTPTKVLVRELKREPVNVNGREALLGSSQPPCKRGSIHYAYVLFTVKPKPKGSKKGKAMHGDSRDIC